MISSLRSSISFWRRSTWGSNAAVVGGVPPKMFWHPETANAAARRPAQAMVERRAVTTRPCCHDLYDEVNPARARFHSTWITIKVRTCGELPPSTFDTIRNKYLSRGELGR